MTRIRVALLAVTVLTFSASAFEDPIADEIQARMQEEARRQEEAYRQMNEIAETPPWEDVEDEGYEDPPPYSAQEWHDWSADLANAEAQRQQAAAAAAGYQAFLNGEWLHTPAANRDEACSILFLRKGTGTIILATGGPQEPALFAFLGMDIPKPTTLTTTRATLSQTGDAPATVDVFNARLPWAPDFGIVFFAVPTAQAAIDGILDTQSFSVAMGGANVAQIDWTQGLAARDKLKACVGSRK